MERFSLCRTDHLWPSYPPRPSPNFFSLDIREINWLRESRIKGAPECVLSFPLTICSRELSLLFFRVHSFLSPPSVLYFGITLTPYTPQCPAAMRSLPIAVLFSLVSVVAAFGKNGHTLRHTHVPRSNCHPKTDETKNQTSAMQGQTDGIQNQTVGMQNQAASGGMKNQTGGMSNQTDVKQNQTAQDVKQNQTVTNGSRYKLVDQYTGQDFLDEA